MKYLSIIILLAFASCKDCTTCEYTLTGYNPITDQYVTESSVYDQELEGNCEMEAAAYEEMRADELQNTIDLQNAQSVIYGFEYSYTLECD